MNTIRGCRLLWLWCVGDAPHGTQQHKPPIALNVRKFTWLRFFFERHTRTYHTATTNLCLSLVFHIVLCVLEWCSKPCRAPSGLHNHQHRIGSCHHSQGHGLSRPPGLDVELSSRCFGEHPNRISAKKPKHPQVL